jgi:hypothetical protein
MCRHACTFTQANQQLPRIEQGSGFYKECVPFLRTRKDANVELGLSQVETVVWSVHVRDERPEVVGA